MNAVSEDRRIVTLQWPPAVDGELMSPWGRVGGPPRVQWSGTEEDPNCEVVGMDPVIIMMTDVVAVSCAPCGWAHDGVVCEVDRAGIMRMTTPAGVWFYELFPARWSDGESFAFYVAVWPD